MRACRFMLQRRAAVILSGCGVFDGSEIHESTSTLIHLNARGIEYTIFAPNMAQMHVVDHQAGAEKKGAEQRNVMSESGRIARGPVSDAAKLNVKDFDALFLPGGFGVMKNLSTFAVQGAAGKVHPDVAQAINAFHHAKKPIGAACIAPVLLAAVIPGAKITLGSTTGDAQTLVKGMGAVLVDAGCEDAVVDEAMKLVSTPAYMSDDAGPAKVFRSIGAMVDAVERFF